MEARPAWLQTFLDRLAANDLSAATRRGYRYDLLQFIAWYTGLNNVVPELGKLTEHDLITWRQHMITQGGLKAASINRRLEAVRHLLRWAEANGAVARNVALHVKSVRVVRERGPLGLTAAEVHGLLRAAGESSQGLARRNYALVQLMLQTGLRVGEVAALRRRDIALRDRAGTVRVRNGKGLKEREVPLNVKPPPDRHSRHRFPAVCSASACAMLNCSWLSEASLFPMRRCGAGVVSVRRRSPGRLRS